MARFRVGEAIGWAGLAVALLTVFRLGATRTSWTIAVGTAMITATAGIVFWRSFTSIEQLRTLLTEGRPKPMLRIIRRKLRYLRNDLRNEEDRSALLLYRAAAESMDGRFEDGLATLSELNEANVVLDQPTGERESWTFSVASTRFSCLLFAERIEEARALFDDKLASFRSREATLATIESMEAQLDYCEGEHIRAERVFEKLTDDTHAAPAARAVFHYFLGRIYADRGQTDKADEEFREARKLAPKTWIPAGITALQRKS